MLKLFDYLCECGAKEERLVDKTDMDAQTCKCGKQMKRLFPLVAANGYTSEFHSFDSMTFDCKVTSQTQLDSLRKQYKLKPNERPRKCKTTFGTIYSYKGQKSKTSRAHGDYVRPH